MTKCEPLASETGETLIEVLISVVIFSLCVVALLGVLVTTITSSSEHRSLASDDTVLRSFAEAAKYEIQMQPGPLFRNCATTYKTNPATAYRVVNVYPSSGPAGTLLTVFSTDFNPGNGVSAIFGSTAITDMTSGSTVNADGNVAATFVVPVVPAGSYPVVLSDGSSSAPSATNFAVTPYLGALSPGSGPSGTSVTVPASGFNANTVLTVTVNGMSATVTGGSPTGTNGAATGTGSTITFTIPTGLTTGTTYPVKVSDGTNSASSSFTAATSVGGPGVATAILTSAVSGTNVGISNVQWWNSSNLSWDRPPSPCLTQDESGIQQVTFTATAPNGVSDQLSIVVTCPGCSPPTPAPAATITASSPMFGQRETFTLTLTGYTTCPTNQPNCVLYPTCPTSQPDCIQWTLTGPGTPTPTRTNTALTQPRGTTNISQSTCVVSSALVGIYDVTANYSGDANYNPTAGYGSVTVSTATPTNVVTNSTPTTLGSNVIFTATVTGSGGVTPTGTVTWMVSGSAGIASCTSSTTTLNSSGNATCSITLSKNGSYVVSDSYSGDSNYAAVASNADSFTVGGLIQTDYSTCTTSCSSHTITLSKATTAGNLIVVSVEAFNGSSAPTVSDSANNIYTTKTENPVASYYEATAYVLNAASTSSVTINTTGASDMSVTIAEFAGYTSLDKFAGAHSTSDGTFSSGLVTTSNADDLLIGTVGTNGSSAITITSSGYTGTTRESVNNASEELAYQAVSSTGSYSFTGTGEGAYWGAQVYAFGS